MPMKILVTGAKGFVGRNLVWNLRNLMTGKDRTRPALEIQDIFEYDIDTDPSLLQQYCAQADFVFHLAGVNRPKDAAEFLSGNVGFTQTLLETLQAQGNCCPVMLSSSVQASLQGRYAGSEYGKSKLAGEQALLEYGRRVGAKVLVYRFPNVFGKWCLPNYNSAVATFCHNIANGLPIQINDRATELELVYIDDLVCELLDALEGREHRSGSDGYCYVPTTHCVTLGEIADLLHGFKRHASTPTVPAMPDGSFVKKLYSTYLTYLPKEDVVIPLVTNSDERGGFTEVLRTAGCGQFSVNVSKPGVTKGQHWHNSKWELFIVVSGEGLIRQRKLDGDQVLEFAVSGKHPQAVRMLPGYTHSITNLSSTQELVTLMWANEAFDPEHPDTYYESV